MKSTGEVSLTLCPELCVNLSAQHFSGWVKSKCDSLGTALPAANRVNGKLWWQLHQLAISVEGNDDNVALLCLPVFVLT